MIDPRAAIGEVHLTISDLDRSLQFYQAHLGFTAHQRNEHTARLGAGDRDLLILVESKTAPRAHRTTGLYHFAVLVPSRADLARALRRLADTGTAMQGAADHGVSEALYLADPDGNGIEIYRDRPRSEWPYAGAMLRMGADPLDLETLLEESRGNAGGLARGTTIGHMHLHVSQLPEAERFYVDVLGFALMQRYGSSAVFVSAGGYHHHIALNTWAGVGAPSAPPGAIGLRHFVVQLPDRPAVEAIANRLSAANVPVETTDRGLFFRDPADNAMLVQSA